MTATALRNGCAGPFGAAYDFYIARAPLGSRRLAGLGDEHAGDVIEHECDLAGTKRGEDPRRSVRRWRRLPGSRAGSAGPVLRGRSRRGDAGPGSTAALERGLRQVEFLRADICGLPFENAAFDLCVSYSGLQCVAAPDVAVAELARCLKPGGALISTTFLSTGTRRQRALLGAGQRCGELGPMGTKRQFHDWLAHAGIARIEISPHEGFVLFRGTKAM